MFAVIFEVQPRTERFDDYLALAARLKPRLEAIDGFIDVDRFKSQRNAGLILSLSTWRDEKAVIRWRTQAEHHGAQEKGRFEIFEDYHLRVGEIVADSAPPRGLAVEQQRFDETAVGACKAVTISELSPMSIRASKQAIQRGLEVSLEKAMAEQREYPAVKAMAASQDYIEGPKAFSEKRPPKWLGK